MRNQRGFSSPVADASADYIAQKRTVIKKTGILVVLHICLAVTVAILIPSEHYALKFILIILVLATTLWAVRIGIDGYSHIMQKQKMNEKYRLEKNTYDD